MGVNFWHELLAPNLKNNLRNNLFPTPPKCIPLIHIKIYISLIRIKHYILWYDR